MQLRCERRAVVPGTTCFVSSNVPINGTLANSVFELRYTGAKRKRACAGPLVTFKPVSARILQ